MAARKAQPVTAPAPTQFHSLTAVTGLYQAKLVGDAEALEVRVIGADVLRWEQVNQKSFFAGEVGLSRIAWIVWAALRRTKTLDVEVAEFMASLEDVLAESDEVDEDEDDDGVELPTPTEADFTA